MVFKPPLEQIFISNTISDTNPSACSSALKTSRHSAVAAKGSVQPRKTRNVGYSTAVILLLSFILDTGIIGGTNAQLVINNYADNLELVSNLAQDEHGSRPKFVKIDEDLEAQSDEYITEYLKRRLQGALDEDDDEDNQILDDPDSDVLKPDTPKPDPTADPDSADKLDALKSRVGKATINVNTEDGPTSSWDIDDFKSRYMKGEIPLILDSITPRAGPTYGETNVLVRAKRIGQYVLAYEKPKCKFGTNDKVVDATYVKCSVTPGSFFSSDSKADKSSTCIQCEAAPPVANEGIINFSVSLTGKFDDADSSLPYRYYNRAEVHAIYPRYGPKDGGTVVQVWGKNFLDLGDDFMCNFGTRATKANFMSSNYMWCRAAFSDVVTFAMPFSVSINRQQNTAEKVNYWYYNDPEITKITPDYGPMGGGTKVVLKGRDFMPWPFRFEDDPNQNNNNQNDTFCKWGELGATAAMVLSSTEAECLSPPNNLHLPWAPVNLTLNNQNYTDDDIRFIYYNPPKIIAAEPLQGPVKGGTVVNLWGTQYEKNRDITCSFGPNNVKAKYITKSHLVCTAPPAPRGEPGDVMLVVKYAHDRFQSDILNYQYFADPQLNAGNPLTPSCGPKQGGTQITLKGKSFVELGFGVAKCIFNNEFKMNATVIDGNTMVCDSPPLDAQNDEGWYNVSVSLDGDFVSKATGKFYYYENPTIDSISPWLGPQTGNTESIITGTGFTQKHICDLKIRYGATHLVGKDIQSNKLKVLSPPAGRPGQVVVSISGNNQQFINDKTLHFRDKENTFEYYQPFVVEQVVPSSISNSGNSPIRIRGMLLDQFHNDDGSYKNVPYQCRFVDSSTGSLIGTVQDMKPVSDTEQICMAPKSDIAGEVRIEITPNGQQWHDVKQPVRYYSGPKCLELNPKESLTKNKQTWTDGMVLKIDGTNFACPKNGKGDDDCSRTKVKFTNNNGDKIFVKGYLDKDKQQVSCLIPAYPAPETLTVEVTFNDQDYTTDGLKFGFNDPYVIGIEPRLIDPNGETWLNMTGFGFVDSSLDGKKDDQTVQWRNKKDKALTCPDTKDGTCIEPYEVHDEHSVIVQSWKQSEVMSEGDNIKWQPFNILMKNAQGKAYSKNSVDVYYYRAPDFKKPSSKFAYSNEEKPVIIETDFFWGKGNDFELFRQRAKLSCRFTSKTKEVVTPAVMETKPIGSFKVKEKPNQIRCRTPKWGTADTASLGVSVNGQNYIGDFEFKFVGDLQIYRIAPLAGPIGGSTKVKLYGAGFRSSDPADVPVYVKFGVVSAKKIDKGQVSEVKWSETDYHSGFNTAATFLKGAERNDVKLEDGDTVEKYISATSPDVSSVYAMTSPDVKGVGGPVYVQVGERVAIQQMNHGASRGEETGEIEVAYPDSSNLEFYFYRQPFVTKIEPTSGLTSGGTVVALTGAWFDVKPQYGIHPYCKIGSHVVRAEFVQTNRILCKTPPSDDAGDPSKVLVSLNGEDFHDTGFTFSYYQKPEVVDIQPRSGSVEGGTEIWLKGRKFSNISSSMKTVRCRFRQIAGEPTKDDEGNSKPAEFDEENAPTKYIPAYYVDKETMRCASPAGWEGGDQVVVDLTFNGVDYTDNAFTFSFYNIYGSFPKSGPADATHQYIQIRGKGFRSESVILCVLNNQELAPLSVHPTVIKCPMVQDDWSPTSYDSVDFHILIDRSRHDFGNFHYYKQIEITKVTPLLGPQEGTGAVYLEGTGFRDDFENAKPSCRIGNTLEPAQLIDSEHVRCLISNKLPLVEDGESLSVSLALNSYSWAPSAYSFKPYGIYGLYPSSGPVSDSTNILVTGKGFENEMKEFARCKFGTDENYAVVEAQVLDNENLICKSPSEELSLPDEADQAISVPFSVAFQEDIYYPYTEGPQKFRLYKHPVLTDIFPVEAQVGKLTEIYVTADEADGFWQPIPQNEGVQNDQYGLKCKFGRFGSAAATYINRTTILCLSPNIQEDPSDIYQETVVVTVAMNGVDFNDENSELEFMFTGTGGRISTWVIVMGTLIFGLLIVSVLIFFSALQEFMSWRAKENNPRSSYTHATEDGAVGPRVNSRSSSAMVGRRTFNPGSRAGHQP